MVGLNLNIVYAYASLVLKMSMLLNFHLGDFEAFKSTLYSFVDRETKGLLESWFRYNPPSFSPSTYSPTLLICWKLLVVHKWDF